MMYNTSIDKMVNVSIHSNIIVKIMRKLGTGLNTTTPLAFSDIADFLDARERIMLLALIPEDDNIRLFSLWMYIEFQLKRRNYLHNATIKEMEIEVAFEENASAPSRINTLRALAFEMTTMINTGVSAEEPWKEYAKYRIAQHDRIDDDVWHDAYSYSYSIMPQLIDKHFSQLFLKAT